MKDECRDMIFSSRSLGKSWASNGKASFGQVMGKSWASHGQAMGKLGTSLGQAMGNLGKKFLVHA